MINLTLRVSVFPPSCSLCLLVNVFPFCALCYHLLAISIAHFNVLYVFCVCMCVCVCARLISCWRLLISCEVLPSFSWLMVDSVMALKTQTPRHRGSNAQIKGELWIWDFILFFTLHLKTYRLFFSFHSELIRVQTWVIPRCVVILYVFRNYNPGGVFVS